MLFIGGITLSDSYAVVYLDALVTSSRQNGMVAKRHLYVALGINMSGQKELQMTLKQSGAKPTLALLQAGVTTGHA